MGKEEELWDDSALIKAFDHAITKYKVMHGMSGSTTEGKSMSHADESLSAAEADNGSNEFGPHAVHVQDVGETANLLQVKENSPLELGSSAKCAGSSNIQNDTHGLINEKHAAKAGSPGDCVISSNVQSHNQATWYSNGPEEYSQLLNKYYELEGQRQQILQQLNQYSNWNYQHPIPNASTSEEYQASDPQHFDTVTCYCPYGCQNWVVPCNSLPASCSGGACNDKSCDAIPEGSQNRNSMSPQDSDYVKTAMVAAEKALSSLKEANGVKDKPLGMEMGHSAESNKSTTDLDVVLNAWYCAGFYTGKYLSEQSFEKRKHSHCS
ncbi:uncharacterized protein LOC105155514 [Sesamum indicum]|uniref:Uncharacterized protein LOC105155514 n=1 Tax=Sesamum indicum TaxID=4182 RepID=A0A6I9SJH8_SESIN|nr:uncharacterized protein LOC105155514 [Sesamum indicum]